jgi:hypothetical protein
MYLSRVRPAASGEGVCLCSTESATRPTIATICPGMWRRRPSVSLARPVRFGCERSAKRSFVLRFVLEDGQSSTRAAFRGRAGLKVQ